MGGSGLIRTSCRSVGAALLTSQALLRTKTVSPATPRSPHCNRNMHQPLHPSQSVPKGAARTFSAPSHCGAESLCGSEPRGRPIRPMSLRSLRPAPPCSPLHRAERQTRHRSGHGLVWLVFLLRQPESCTWGRSQY